MANATKLEPLPSTSKCPYHFLCLSWPVLVRLCKALDRDYFALAMHNATFYEMVYEFFFTKFSFLHHVGTRSRSNSCRKTWKASMTSFTLS